MAGTTQPLPTALAASQPMSSVHRFVNAPQPPPTRQRHVRACRRLRSLRPCNSGRDEVQLAKLHDELLQQIEERKKLQSKLAMQLQQSGVLGSQDNVAAPAAPSFSGAMPITKAPMQTVPPPATPSVAPPSPQPPTPSPPPPQNTSPRPRIMPGMSPAAVIAAQAAAPSPVPAPPKPATQAAAPAAAPAPAPAPVSPPPVKSSSRKDVALDDLQLLTEQFEKQRAKSRQQKAAVVAPPPPVAAPVPVEPLPKVADPPAPLAVAEGVAAIVDAAAEADGPDAPEKPPCPAGENAMKVVLVGAECAPWSKTGGLGDVMSALPKALARRGHRVMVVVPRYANYDDAWDVDCRRVFRVFGGEQLVAYFHCYKDGVDYVFVDHPCYHAWANNIYGGDRQDLQFRNALLCKAALEAPWHVPCGGVPYGDDNLVFIANDWHTALLPLYLQVHYLAYDRMSYMQAHYRDYDKMTYARSMFVIHNIAHQGRAPMVEACNLEVPEHYTEMLKLYDPIGGEHMNIMKAGLITAHKIVAVSHGYAWECQTSEGGWGLDAVLRDQAQYGKLRGIVNGIDYLEWNPEIDVHLQTDGYENYTADTLKEGKAKCKAALQKELGLPVDPNVPMLGFIGRLDYQKGVDLIRDSYGFLMEQGCQLVMLGSGREDLETNLREMESWNKDKCRGWVGFSTKMAHRITAGCDLLLMPSRFEPCGLNQLYAMAYGTVPIVHHVGGLRDTVTQYNPYDNTGTGWTFSFATADGLRDAAGHAINTYRQYRDSFDGIAKRGMEQDLSWDNAAKLYEEVLVAAKYVW